MRLLRKVVGIPIFQNISSKSPLTIVAGGSRAPFDQRECQLVLSEGRPYQCDGNFWWHEITWMNNHRVPISNAQIQAIQRFYFPPLAPPDAWPTNLNVHVRVDTPSVDHKLFGALQRVSPEEVTHAMLLSVAEAITAGADDTVLSQWRESRPRVQPGI